MKIGYIGGFWATNIGNSFYNLGAVHLLENVFGKNNVSFIPDPPQEYWSRIDNDYKFIEKLDLDLFLLTGPSFNLELISVYRPIFDKLKQCGKKIGFLSVGASNYTESEANAVSEFLNEYPIEFIMTRDSVTYNLYKDKLKTKLFDGICTSMFLNDVVNLANVNDDYIIFNFSPKKEPKISMENGKYSTKYSKSPWWWRPTFQKELDGNKIVRTNNNFFIPKIPILHKGKGLFYTKDMYYSDLPYGYLTILKSAKLVFSDRVHTCAATLILGGSAMYVKGSARSHDGRNNLFSRIGVKEIYNKQCKLDFSFINKEKVKMLDFLVDYKNENN